MENKTVKIQFQSTERSLIGRTGIRFGTHEVGPPCSKLQNEDMIRRLNEDLGCWEETRNWVSLEVLGYLVAMIRCIMIMSRKAMQHGSYDTSDVPPGLPVRPDICLMHDASSFNSFNASNRCLRQNQCQPNQFFLHPTSSNKLFGQLKVVLLMKTATLWLRRWYYKKNK